VPSPQPRAAHGGLGQRLVRALSNARTHGAASDAVLREVSLTLGAAFAVLWLRDEKTGLLRWSHDWAAGDGLDELQCVGRRLTFAPGVGLLGMVLETAEPAWVEDIRAAPDFPRADVALRAGMHSLLAAPLVSPDGVMGVIEFFGPGAYAPTAEQLEDVTLAAAQLAAYLGRLQIEDRLRLIEESSASIAHAALDCIITMDHEGRVLSFNPAAEATFGYESDAAVGELLADLIIPLEFRSAHQHALADYVRSGAARILGRRLELTGMRADGSTFPVELTVTRVGTREPPVFAGFIRDITDRRTAEAQLTRLLEREQAERARAEQAERAARDVAEALQRSLLPPHLPAVTGLELGAAYRAGTAGWRVGGDFYDVFKLARGLWAVAIGDVCGKGPKAASLTGIVRYALRYAAVRESSPSAVLSTVNEELLRDGHGDFCTAIFATVDVRGPEPLVRMAVGGHPLPLLARADGTVAPVGIPGSLLGAFPGTVVHDFELRLGPGELLLLYTDGLTEAMTSDGRFGEPRLAALLERSTGLHPQHLADRVDETVLAARVGEAADDVALLAVRADVSQRTAA
jgi:sigma-B regulation protein RsbU (phosphoserine phosphatase)